MCVHSYILCFVHVFEYSTLHNAQFPLEKLMVAKVFKKYPYSEPNECSS
jgi:hypothetical protein